MADDGRHDPVQDGAREATDDERIAGIVDQVRADILLGTQSDVISLLRQRHLDRAQEDADHWIREGMNSTCSIPNPLPFETATPSPRTAKTVLSIGRLSEEKGYDLLLDAWVDKTADFLASPACKAVSALERARMRTQLRLMCELSTVLGARIAAFTSPSQPA